MRVSVRTPVTLSESTVGLEEDYLWDSEEVYSAGDLAYSYDDVSGESFFYLSNIDDNVGNQPPNFTKWTQVGPSNQWAMFSEYFDTATKASEKLEVGFQCGGPIDTLVLTGVVASYVDISVYSSLGGTLLVQRQILITDYRDQGTATQLSGDDTYFNMFHTYFPEVYDSPYVVLNFVPVSGVTLSCGKVFVGRSVYLGETQFGNTAGIADYSKTETSEFGVLEYEPGTYAKILAADVYLDDDMTDFVKTTLTATNASLNFWDFNNEDTNFSSIRAYGYPRSWEVKIGAPNSTFAALEINSAASRFQETFFYMRISHLTGSTVFSDGGLLKASKLSGAASVDPLDAWKASHLTGNVAVPDDLRNKISQLTGQVVGKQNNPLQISKATGISVVQQDDPTRISGLTGSASAFQDKKTEISAARGYLLALKREVFYPTGIVGLDLTLEMGGLIVGQIVEYVYDPNALVYSLDIGGFNLDIPSIEDDHVYTPDALVYSLDIGILEIDSGVVPVLSTFELNFENGLIDTGILPVNIGYSENYGLVNFDNRNCYRLEDTYPLSLVYVLYSDLNISKFDTTNKDVEISFDLYFVDYPSKLTNFWFNIGITGNGCYAISVQKGYSFISCKVNSTTKYLTIGQSIPVDTWNNFKVIIRETSMELYYNNNLVNTQTATAAQLLGGLANSASGNHLQVQGGAYEASGYYVYFDNLKINLTAR